MQAANMELLPELYKRAATTPARFIRFKGVFTDGGVDEDLPRFWCALPQDCNQGSAVAFMQGRSSNECAFFLPSSYCFLPN